MAKIGFIIPLYLKSKKYGGATKFSILLAQEFQKAGHKVEILIPWAEDFRTTYNPFVQDKSPEVEYLENLKIKKFRLKWYKNIPNFFFRILFKYKKSYFKSNFFNKFFTFIGPHFQDIENYIIKEKFDVIHLNCLPYYYMVEIPKKLKALKFNGKTIATPFFHTEKTDWFNPIFKEFFENCDQVHTATKYEKLRLIETFEVPDSKVTCLPLFLNPTEYQKMKEIESEVEIFKKSKRLKNKIIVLCIHSDKPNTKGFQETKEVFLKLRNKNIVLIVIGNENIFKEDFKENILNLGRPIELQKNVIFASADIFCMPSATESFGLVYLEAWNYKKPIIALDSPQMKELFHEGGLFAKPNNINSLSICLKKLIENEHLRKKLGEKGYEKLQKNFLLQNLIKDYLKMFLGN